jgi:hypothetical protein
MKRKNNAIKLLDNYCLLKIKREMDPLIQMIIRIWISQAAVTAVMRSRTKLESFLTQRAKKRIAVP